MKYMVRDSEGEGEVEADSALSACRAWVDGWPRRQFWLGTPPNSDWGDGEHTKTFWVTCRATPIVDGEEDEEEEDTITIRVDPDEPDCVEGETHEWVSPLPVVGGIESNPGVFGHGGGVIIVCVCRKCGRYQRTDTWATNPENGEQGLESVEYMSADSTSLDWISKGKA